MIDSDTINIVVAGIGIVIPVLVSFLTAHKVVSKRRLNSLYSYALYAAHAAEELYGTSVAGDIKQKYALERLVEKTGISKDEGLMLLNAAVSGLRAAGIKPPKRANPSNGTVPILVTTPGPAAA